MYDLAELFQELFKSRGVAEVVGSCAELDDVVIGGMKQHKICGFRPNIAQRFLHPVIGVRQGRVAHDDPGVDAERVLGLANQLPRAVGDIRHEFDAYSVPAEESALYQGCAESSEQVDDNFTLLGEPSHDLMGDLRDEIAPILRRVGAGLGSPAQKPEAIELDIVVVLPAIQVQV